MLTDEKILLVIRQALFDMLGDTPAKAVDFFVDSRLAIREPDRYERAMKEVFREGAKVVIERVEKDLCAMAGIQMQSWPSFSACIKTVENKS